MTFNSDATYNVTLDDSQGTADKVIAKRTTINNNAQVSFTALRNTVLPVGTIFKMIDNTAATPIGGRFANLADGSTLTVDGNTFQVNYEGGDNNDLTLTVVP